MRHAYAAGMAALAFAVIATPVLAQTSAGSDDDARYNIMTPEPWLRPKYKSPRGSIEHVVIPQPSAVPQTRAVVPPPLYVPQRGQLLPNIPTIAPSGPAGAETGQDRAMRCANQAGIYGQAAGNHNAYVGSCINQ
jgi:hypothetical protein